MKRFSKIALGVLTMLPLVGLIAFPFPFLASFDALEQAGDISPQLVAGGPVHLVPIMLGTVFLTLALWLFYCAWLVRTDRLGRLAKVGWAVLITVAGPLAMPVLWWRHLRPPHEAP